MQVQLVTCILAMKRGSAKIRLKINFPKKQNALAYKYSPKKYLLHRSHRQQDSIGKVVLLKRFL